MGIGSLFLASQNLSLLLHSLLLCRLDDALLCLLLSSCVAGRQTRALDVPDRCSATSHMSTLPHRQRTFLLSQGQAIQSHRGICLLDSRVVSCRLSAWVPGWRAGQHLPAAALLWQMPSPRTLALECVHCNCCPQSKPSPSS